MIFLRNWGDLGLILLEKRSRRWEPDNLRTARVPGSGFPAADPVPFFNAPETQPYALWDEGMG